MKIKKSLKQKIEEIREEIRITIKTERIKKMVIHLERASIRERKKIKKIKSRLKSSEV